MSVKSRTTRSGERRYDVRLRRPDGTVYTRTFRTRREAEGFDRSERVTMDRGVWVDNRSAAVAFATYADDWLCNRTVRGKPLTPRTVDAYRYLLEGFVNPAFGTTALSRITSSAVRSWHARLVAEAPKSVAPKAYRLLHAVMATAAADEIIASNPCRIQGASGERAPERPVLTVEQIADLARVIEPHWRCLVLVAAYGGLRFGELLGLRRRDIDLLHGEVIVDGQLVELRDGSHVRAAPKSAAGKRTVAVPNFVVKELESHLQTYVAGDPDSLVFTGDRGGSPCRRNWARTWGRARSTAGLPDTVHLHDLRHSGATLSAQLGATTKELMARLGHASPRAALIYQHAAEGRDRVLADAMDEIAAGITAARRRTVSAHHAAGAITRDGRAMEAGRGSAKGGDRIVRIDPYQDFRDVETMGLEPTTPCLQSRCSSS